MPPSILHYLIQVRNHKGLLRYAGNTSWMLAEQLLRMVAGLLIGIWVARLLGPEQFGVFSYVLAFVAIFGSFAKFGLDGIVVRNIVNEPDKTNTYLGSAFWLKTVAALISIFAIVGILPVLNNDIKTNHYILIVAGGIFFQAFEVFEFYFQSKVLSRYVASCKLAQLLISSLLKLYLIWLDAELFWFVYVTLLDQLVLAGTLYVAYQYKANEVEFSFVFDWEAAKSLLASSWPLIISSLVVVIHIYIERLIIKELLGAAEVGIYSAAIRLSEVWYFVPVIITHSLFTAIIEAKKKSDELYLKRLHQLFTLMTWMAIGIALTISILSNWLVIQLYGKAYQVAGHILSIHIWGLVFVFHVSIRSSVLLVEEKQIYVTMLALLALAIHIPVTYMLLRYYGLVGAAYASVASWFICVCVLPLLFKDIRKFTTIFLKSISGVNK